MTETISYKQSWKFDTWEEFLEINKTVCDQTNYTTYFARMTLEELAELCGGIQTYKEEFHRTVSRLRRGYRESVEPSDDDYMTARVHYLINRDGKIKDNFGISNTSYNKTFYIHPGYRRLILVGCYSKPVDVVIHSKHPESYDLIDDYRIFEKGWMNIGNVKIDNKDNTSSRDFLDVVKVYPGNFRENTQQLSGEEKVRDFTFGDDYVLFKDQPFALIKDRRWTVAPINC